MNTATLAPSASPQTLAAIQKKNFRVTITTDPAVLAMSPPKFVNLLLGNNQSPNATAVLSNFAFAGGTVTKHFMNGGARGHFSSAITMHCYPESPAPQVIGLLGSTLTQFAFNVAIDTSCSTNDWFTLWLLDEGATWFPSTAVDRPGLFASVSWNTSKVFTTAGYAGNGMIDGQSDSGFRATVVAL